LCPPGGQPSSGATAASWRAGRLIKVTLNGQVIQENVEIPHPTPAGLTGREMPEGPLMLQDDHGPVSFRNIKITVPQGK
jgi:hypothetical protein